MLWCAVRALLCVSVVSAQEYRFVFTKIDGRHANYDAVALSDIELLGWGGEDVHISRIENPGGTFPRVVENADRAIDDDLTTKWIDTSFTDPTPTANTSILQFHLFNPNEVILGYRFFTANDAPHRDPVSWQFEKRTSDNKWTIVHSVSDFLPPMRRSTSYLPNSDAFWVTAPPPAPPLPEYRLVVTSTRDVPVPADAVSLSEVVLWTTDRNVARIHSISNPGGSHPYNQGPFEAADKASLHAHMSSVMCPLPNAPRRRTGRASGST